MLLTWRSSVSMINSLFFIVIVISEPFDTPNDAAADGDADIGRFGPPAVQ